MFRMTPMDDFDIPEGMEIAWQKRFCPPLRLADHPEDEQMAAHRIRCPVCRDRLDDLLFPQMLEAAQLIRKISPLPGRPERIETGQIWTLDRALGGWSADGRYRCPPRVLVVRELPHFPEAVHAVQIHDEPDFQALGDVQIDDDGMEFAEPWNLSTLRRTDLAQYWGGVDKDNLASVLRFLDGPFPELDKDSLIYKFRCLEVDAGSFFSLQAVADLVSRLETKKQESVVKPHTAFEELAIAAQTKAQTAWGEPIEFPCEGLLGSVSLAFWIKGIVLEALLVSGGPTEEVTVIISSGKKVILRAGAPTLSLGSYRSMGVTSEMSRENLVAALRLHLKLSLET